MGRSGQSVDIYFFGRDDLENFIVNEKHDYWNYRIVNVIQDLFLSRIGDVFKFFNYCEPILKRNSHIKSLEEFYHFSAGEKEWDISGREASWAELKKEFYVKSKQYEIPFSVTAGVHRGPYLLHRPRISFYIERDGGGKRFCMWQDEIANLKKHSSDFLPRYLADPIDSFARKIDS